MDDLDAVALDGLRREVLLVEGDQRVRIASRGRGEHVPVFGVACHVGDEVCETVDQRGGAERVAHGGHSAGGVLAADADLGQVPFYFVEDRVRPQHLEQSCFGKP
ncbi:MAG TPA: hypothetical protein VGH43_00330 [Jatrophihabitans sp.]